MCFSGSDSVENDPFDGPIDRHRGGNVTRRIDVTPVPVSIRRAVVTVSDARAGFFLRLGFRRVFSFRFFRRALADRQLVVQKGGENTQCRGAVCVVYVMCVCVCLLACIYAWLLSRWVYRLDER